MKVGDYQYLIKITEKDHIEENGMTIDECGIDNCWHKRVRGELDNTAKKLSDAPCTTSEGGKK